MTEVFVSAGGVGHDIEMPEWRTSYDQIVNYASVVVGEQRQCSVIVGEASHITHDQTLHELDLIAPADCRL